MRANEIIKMLEVYRQEIRNATLACHNAQNLLIDTSLKIGGDIVKLQSEVDKKLLEVLK